MKLTFSLILIFCLTKTENRTTKSPTQLSTITFSILQKNADFLQKNANIRKIKRDLILKGIFSKTKHVCVLMYQV